jgi:hypothetical protein
MKRFVAPKYLISDMCVAFRGGSIAVPMEDSSDCYNTRSLLRQKLNDCVRGEQKLTDERIARLGIVANIGDDEKHSLQWRSLKSPAPGRALLTRAVRSTSR